MFPDFVLKKKDMVLSVATAFLPKTVMIPLRQEDGVQCAPLVKAGDRIFEGQTIAEDSAGSESAKIHSPIPGLALGIKNCPEPDGRYGPAVEIKLSGSFSHIGKERKEFDWLSWGGQSIANRIGALGVVNTFSARACRSLGADIKAAESSGTRPLVFARLFDEDPSCQTDRTLTAARFDKILTGLKVIKKTLSPAEIIFARSKFEERASDESAAREALEDPSCKTDFISFDTRTFPNGTKEAVAARYKKVKKLPEDARTIASRALFVDATTLAILADSLVCNVPVERVFVHVSGDCLKAGAVFKVCVGTSFKSFAGQLGLSAKKIGTIIVNGQLNGFSAPSLETPVTKCVKSVAFVSKSELADCSSGFCMNCGSCLSACPSGIYPSVLYGHLIRSVKIPQDFIRSSALCSECGVCNLVCPTKLPLSEAVKILKDRQNG